MVNTGFISTSLEVTLRNRKKTESKRLERNKQSGYTKMKLFGVSRPGLSCQTQLDVVVITQSRGEP